MCVTTTVSSLKLYTRRKLLAESLPMPCLALAKSALKDKDDLEAIDDGGPTRAFVSEVMRQMETLKVVSSGGRETSLFDKTNFGFCAPQSNDFLKNKLGLQSDEEEARGVVHPYYRALGRILFYCIAQNITIASIALPELYRNYLLRGIDPEDERYSLPDLAHDVVRLVPLKYKEGDYQDAIRKYLLAFNDDKEIPLDHDTFRAKVKENFIDSCDIALDALKEGLSLDGECHMLVARVQT